MFIDASMIRLWLRSKERKTTGFLTTQVITPPFERSHQHSCTPFYKHLTPNRGERVLSN